MKKKTKGKMFSNKRAADRIHMKAIQYIHEIPESPDQRPHIKFAEFSIYRTPKHEFDKEIVRCR